MRLKRMLRNTVGVFLLLLLTPGLAVHPALAEDATGTFQTADCMFPVPDGLQEGVDLQCGYLEVPERYEDPNGPTIHLAVAIIRNQTGKADRDPVFFAQGGPGGSTLDLFPSMLVDHPLRRTHDLVLFDQRGTLYSNPKLACPEFLDESLKVLDEDISDEESNRLYRQAADACHDRLVSQGIDLSAFNSLENAHDVESLRQALGYDQINFYGVSYGTLLAQHVMRAYPESLRSVILDGVVPPEVDFNFEATRTIDGAFTQLFKACADDEACNREFPNLEQVFFSQVDRLDQTPVTIRLTDTTSGEAYSTLLNGDGLIETLIQSIYSSELLPMLPKMIYDVQAGEYTLVERVLSLVTFDRTVMEGMYYSVICAEDGSYDPSKVDTSGIRPRLLQNENADNQAFSQLCTDWAVQPIGDQADQPITSSVPTLLLNGRFDPVTPERYGKLVAQTLSNSYLYTFPNTAHGAIGNECANEMMASFVDHPDSGPTTECLAQQRMSFVTSREVIDFPVMIKALNLDPSSALQLGGILLLTLFLLTAWLYFPLAWLVRLVRGKSRPITPPVGRLAPWVALAAGLVLLLFCVGLTVAAVQMVQANDVLILMGIGADYRWVFVLPPIFAVLALAMLFLAAVGWSGHYWSGWRKFYYTLLALAGVACVALLAFTGALVGWMG